MNSKEERGRLMKAAEAANYMNVSPRKFEAWVRSGFIPTVRLDGTVRRFDVRALDEIIEAGTRTGEARR